MNRKLIRTTLAEVKEKEQQLQQQALQARLAAQEAHQARQAAAQQQQQHQQHPQSSSQPAPLPPLQLKKKIPPEQTNAETFYYKKQMDSKTPMVIVLQDAEVLRGTIEWYDRGSIKLHRLEGPNLLILKHNIKYLYKDQAGPESD